MYFKTDFELYVFDPGRGEGGVDGGCLSVVGVAAVHDAEPMAVVCVVVCMTESVVCAVVAG